MKMRLALTKKELELSSQIQKVFIGSTFDEALHALAHAEGSIKAVLNDVSIGLIFRPIGEDSP